MNRYNESGSTGSRSRRLGRVARRPSLEILEGRQLLAGTGSLDPTFAVPTASTPPASADLAITETNILAPSSFPGSLSFTLTVTNSGPNAATNVIVSDTLPPGTMYDQGTPSQGSPVVSVPGMDGTSTTLTDNLGTIAAGQSATLTVTLTRTEIFTPPFANPPLVNTANVTSDATDPNLANNSVTQTVTVPTVALSLTQTTLTPVARYGQIELFDVTVTNSGTVAAPGVVVQDAYPASAVLLNVGPTQGTVMSIGSGQALVNLGTIAPNGSASVIVVVVPTTTGDFVNTAEVTTTAVNVINLGGLNPLTALSMLSVPAVDGPVVQSVTRGSNGSSAVVTFDEALDPTSAKQRTNFRVVDLGLASLHHTTGRTIGTRSVAYTSGSKSVTITTSGRLNSSHEYALILGGSTPKGLLDASGRRLVGNGSGVSSASQANMF